MNDPSFALDRDVLIWFRRHSDVQEGERPRDEAPADPGAASDPPPGWTDSIGTPQRLLLQMLPGRGYGLLRVQGVIDGATLPAFGRGLERTLREAGPNVLVDLSLAQPSTVDWVSSINEIREPIESAGGVVVLVAPSAMATSHLDLLGLGDLFAIASSVGEAESIAGGA